jgi:hypothetical protein
MSTKYKTRGVSNEESCEVKYGVAGGATGAGTCLALGFDAIGIVGGTCLGAAALPVFAAIGVLGGLAVLGIRSRKKY